MLRSFLGEGHGRMAPFPPPSRHLSSLTPQCQNRKLMWTTTEVPTVLLYFGPPGHQIASATSLEARVGHRTQVCSTQPVPQSTQWTAMADVANLSSQ